jgi:hypothetical protein
VTLPEIFSEVLYHEWWVERGRPLYLTTLFFKRNQQKLLENLTANVKSQILFTLRLRLEKEKQPEIFVFCLPC